MRINFTKTKTVIAGSFRKLRVDMDASPLLFIEEKGNSPQDNATKSRIRSHVMDRVVLQRGHWKGRIPDKEDEQDVQKSSTQKNRRLHIGISSR
jgi:hypothetical protein